MSALYKRIEELCREKNETVTTMCKESGASRASLSDLKVGRKQGLSADTLAKIAVHFGVSVDYLITGLQKSKTTNFANGICAYSGSSMQEIEKQLTEREDGTYRVVYRSSSIVITVDADCNPTDEQVSGVIAIYDPNYAKKAPTGSGERSVSDDDIKFALFRGREEITDAMYEEVLNFAEYVARREEEKKRKEQ